MDPDLGTQRGRHFGHLGNSIKRILGDLSPFTLTLIAFLATRSGGLN